MTSKHFSLIEAVSCPICQERPAVKAGRCLRCYGYYHRTGRERPGWLRAKINQCVICRERYVAQAGRCLRCYAYYRDNGEERPPTVIPRGRHAVTTKERQCINGCPSGPIARGRCWPCYQYFRRNGRERPAPRSGPIQ